MSFDPDYYEHIMDTLSRGSVPELEKIAARSADFPKGTDDAYQQPWILVAASNGVASTVQWMIERGVNLDFRHDDGFTVLHAALEREGDEKYPIMRCLLDAGAPINAYGTNGWTPAHMAAAYEDIEGLRILVEYGADLSIRTEIDDYTTPLEEARNLGKQASVDFLLGCRGA